MMADKSSSSSDMEKADSHSVREYTHEVPDAQTPVQQLDARYAFDVADLDRVQRRLKQRHIQMIAIAGTLGTGLFLGSGDALAGAGPLGALIAYALVGSVSYATLCSVGEMTSHAPISGTFPHFAARWVDPALGFALGWNYFYSGAITIPVEITAASILLTFWDQSHDHQIAYIAALCVCMCAVNIFGVRWFGESEVFFSVIKLVLIIGLIITGLIIDLGGGPTHDRLGFRYWKSPGAIAGAGLVSNVGLDRLLGILSVIVQAAFSFQGIELVAIAASETENPRRNIKKAVKRVFFRICLFYMLGVFVTGILVPSDDPNLLNPQGEGTAAQSPYVIAMTRAGIKVLPSIVNALIFTSAFSAGNTFLFSGSRILYGLAIRRQAPKIFAKCTSSGLPLPAILFCCLFTLLAFMNVTNRSQTVFNWLVNVTTIAGFFGWGTINLTYIFFYRGYKAQGLDRKNLVYHHPWQPYVAYWGLGMSVFFTLINGFEVFFKFNTSDFLTAYINIPIFFGLYFFWKIRKSTKIWKPSEMDFVTGIPSIEETEGVPQPPISLSVKIAEKVF